jgi:hypothetical protein
MVVAGSHGQKNHDRGYPLVASREAPTRERRISLVEKLPF